MLPISEKGKNITIIFIECHNVLFKENYFFFNFFIRGQLFCAGIRKIDEQIVKEMRSKPYLPTDLLAPDS